jgi:hypothetical protein
LRRDRYFYRLDPNFRLNYQPPTLDDDDNRLWVDDVADRKGLISAYGLGVYRYPDTTPNDPAHSNPTGIQANFEIYIINSATGERVRVGSGHMSIISTSVKVKTGWR